MKYLVVLLLGLLVLTACHKTEPSVPFFTQPENYPGGEMTTARLHLRSYVYPGQRLSKKQQLDFWTGFSLFRDPWVAAPSSTTDRDGLGPLFNTRSCIACHQNGARAAMSEPGVSLPSALVIRLGNKEADSNMVDPHYGGQIQPRSISTDLPGEAWLDLQYTQIKGRYPDGQSYSLQKPSLQLTRFSDGPLSQFIAPSPRYAPNIYGMGLLDAIDQQDLLQQEDITDSDGDGISAKYNRVTNVANGQIEIGRFGLKAKQPNLKQQVAAAFRDDIGITNELFSEESCTSEQNLCRQQDSHTDIEIPAHLLKLVVDFSLFIGVPPTRNMAQQAIQQGRAAFYRSGCAQCHTPSYTTKSDYPVEALAGQTIWPYSDLALHDMGEALADGVFEFDADGREWRTPPLWGLGLQQSMVANSRFLHDGRARTLEEAILWHGGEGEKAKQRFMRLSKNERNQLIEFLKAI